MPAALTKTRIEIEWRMSVNRHRVDMHSGHQAGSMNFIEWHKAT